MLRTRPSEPSHLAAGRVDPFTHLLLLLAPPAPGASVSSTLFLRSHVSVIPHSVCLSPLAKAPGGESVLSQKTGFSSFLRLNHTSLRVCIRRILITLSSAGI